MADHDLFIDEEGNVSGIYADALAPVFEAIGQTETRRASHVEPCRAGWTADLTPVGGPVLGPFTMRQAALDAEVAWIKAAQARGTL